MTNATCPTCGSRIKVVRGRVVEHGAHHANVLPPEVEKRILAADALLNALDNTFGDGFDIRPNKSISLKGVRSATEAYRKAREGKT